MVYPERHDFTRSSSLDQETNERLADYIHDLFGPEDEVLKAIRARTEDEGLPQIQIRPEEGLMLQFLISANHARRVIELGTLAGYSGVWIGRALPEDGRLITVEIDEQRAEVARESFRQAGLDGRVEVRVGSALESLAELAVEGPFDAIFIDALKTEYPAYLAWAIDNIRVGGLIVAHNAFRRGRIVAPVGQHDDLVKSTLAFNRQLSEDPRLLGTIIPMGDGLAVAVRLAEA
jgi:caffeoyl-CoA O-methyltransferase